MLFLAIVVTYAFFLWEGHTDFNLADEGFFWYGVQQVMHGEVPIRDFMAYDPGRYYWSSALLSLWHVHGIIALRVTAAIFQALGVFIGLIALARTATKQGSCWWLLVAFTLTLWMNPWFKVFDICCAIALIGVFALLIEQPSYPRYFFAGFIVGVVAIFGRNHGVYGVLASLGVMVYLAIANKNRLAFFKILTTWSIGIVVGYLPVLLMVALIPGFAKAFWESILFLFRVKATNIALPIPWPWHFLNLQTSLEHVLSGVLLGGFFIAIVSFGVFGIIWVIRERLNQRPVSSVLVATVFLALPYAQYAYSRADVVHLALGITPFLMGSFAILADQVAKIKWRLGLFLCGASLFVVLPAHPGWLCHVQQCVKADVAGDQLEVTPGEAGALTMLTKLTARFAPDNRNILVAPFWPGAYAVMQRKSPMWGIYALFPSTKESEQAEIERIKMADPGYALIINSGLDGRNELRFRNTHSLIYQYIVDHFTRVDGLTLNPEYQLYINKQTVQ